MTYKGKDLEISITKMLHELGMPSHIKGYQYIREGIIMIYNNPDIIVTKNAYVLFYRQKKMENYEWDNIYKKQYVDIKDDFNVNNTNEIKYNSNKKNKVNIISNIIELNEEKDEKEIEEENSSMDEISLREFVYNPFKETYLKLKRRLKRNSKKK